MNDADNNYARNKYFMKDDFERINIKYFAKLRENNMISGDPSFWFDTYSSASNYIEVKNVQNYRSDYQNSLKEYKETILDLINEWDKQKYNYNEVTLCSSVTSGSLIVLTMLKNIGVENIYFETPAYFASVNQSDMLGFKTTLVPTYLDNNFHFDTTFLNKEITKKKAIWLTQPRFALGYNQSSNDICEILSKLNHDDFLIIDEATEQLFPVCLSEINFKLFPNIIKIRSIFKGMGLNGPRISFISHNKKYRSIIADQMEYFQGAIDVFSLLFAKEICSNSTKFKCMIDSSNHQTVNLREKIDNLLFGTKIVSLKLENGYIGSVAVNFESLKTSYLKSRENLLKYCFNNKVPVILGATMNFAKDEKYEYVRVNYFNKELSVLNGINILTRFFEFI